jgi:hypothetical protein
LTNLTYPVHTGDCKTNTFVIFNHDLLRKAQLDEQLLIVTYVKTSILEDEFVKHIPSMTHA